MYTPGAAGSQQPPKGNEPMTALPLEPATAEDPACYCVRVALASGQTVDVPADWNGYEERVAGSDGTDPLDALVVEIESVGVPVRVQRRDLCWDDGSPIVWQPYEVDERPYHSHLLLSLSHAEAWARVIGGQGPLEFQRANDLFGDSYRFRAALLARVQQSPACAGLTPTEQNDLAWKLDSHFVDACFAAIDCRDADAR